MSELRDDISFYETLKSDLEAAHFGKWVLIRSRELVGVYSSMEEAAGVAVQRFGRGPYLIRQIGAPPVTLPASVMYHPIHVEHQMRIR
jgi:hypothetical protein